MTAEEGRENKQRQALLGRLASLGWFTRRGEVAATQALAVLLEEPHLREALVGHIGQAIGTELSAVESFQPELIHADGARPDLEGQDSLGRPLVVVEAKFGAILSSEQVEAYLADQEARLTDGARGALVLLVPSYRKPEAESLLGALSDRADSLSPEVATGAATWDEWLDALDESAQQLDPAERDAVRCDVRQLRALCATMRGVDVPPLKEVAKGVGMDEREGDLRRLVDEVTRRFRFPTGQLIPIGFESEFGYYRRYMPGGPDDPACCCSVGVLSGFGDTPFWLRFHKDTSSFQEVANRIMASPLAEEAGGNGGHIWLPLRVSDDRSGEAILSELAAQIEAIQAVAAGAEPR
jgi:hypothetical protein